MVRKLDYVIIAICEGKCQFTNINVNSAEINLS